MSTTAKQFFEKWVESVHEMEAGLTQSWRNSKKFTSMIKSAEDCIVRKIANKMGLKCYPHDYYAVDSVFYQESDLVPNIPKDSTWLSGISIAFEHENWISSGIYKEVSHLLILNADLRVLVTYPKNGIEDGEFKYAAEIIQKSRHHCEIFEKESFLLILGSETNFQWEGFIYKEGKWKKIEEEFEKKMMEY